MGGKGELDMKGALDFSIQFEVKDLGAHLCHCGEELVENSEEIFPVLLILLRGWVDDAEIVQEGAKVQVSLKDAGATAPQACCLPLVELSKLPHARVEEAAALITWTGAA
jgi:hypothetical protein